MRSFIEINHKLENLLRFNIDPNHANSNISMLQLISINLPSLIISSTAHLVDSTFLD